MNDPYAATYTAIVGFLKGNSAFFNASPPSPDTPPRTKVYSANFVDYTVAQPYPGKPLDKRQPGDFPACYVLEDAETDTGILGTMKTFGQCAYPVHTTIQYGIWIVGADTRLPVVSGLRWAAKQALYGAGQKFGFSNQTVFSWTWQSRIQIIDKLMIGNLDACAGPRCVCKITIPVQFQFDGLSITT